MSENRKHRCEKCGAEADHRGWYLTMRYPKRRISLAKSEWKRSYHWWCDRHFMEHMFNLWPFQCTKACARRHEKRIGGKFSEKELIVYLRLETTLVSALPKRKTKQLVKANAAIPMKPLGPRCPRCSRRMKYAPEPRDGRNPK